MRDHSFPVVAFKNNFDERSSSSSIEYYHLQNREPLLTNKCNCPNQHETAKQDIQSMISYIPQKVAMLNISNPCDDYKILQNAQANQVWRDKSGAHEYTPGHGRIHA